MKLMSRGDMYRRTSRELDGMRDEIRKDIGNCERRKRRDLAALADIRAVQGQRKVQRPNL